MKSFYDDVYYSNSEKPLQGTAHPENLAQKRNVEPVVSLREMARVAKKDARFVILVPNAGSRVSRKWKDLHVLSWNWVTMNGWLRAPYRACGFCYRKHPACTPLAVQYQGTATT